MKNICWFSFFLMLLFTATACAQTIVMPVGYCAFDYPDSWLVLSPQRCRIYATILEDMGLDPDDVAETMEAQGVLTRAMPEAGGESYAVIVRQDEISQNIFDISEATDSDRKQMKARAEDNRLWERTGYRAQDAAWQIEGGRYWLYIHYVETDQGEVLSRGLRYYTIYNGKYIGVDWNIKGRRFTNRDLTAFRKELGRLTFLQIGEAPVRMTQLSCNLPTETNEAAGRITGTVTAGAKLTLTADDGKGNRETLTEDVSDSKGRFTLDYMLPREGEWRLTLLAEAEGRESAVVEGMINYSEKKLPVSGIPETIISTGDKITISGKTLSGATMQLVTPYGITKKRAENDGTFSFELTTKEVGRYEYTLLIDKSGYTQRRLRFDIVRQQTDEQERQAVRDRAVRISYGELTRDLSKNQGSIMNLYGYVSEVSEAGSSYYVRMMYSRDKTGGWINPVILVSSEKTGAKAGDLMTCTVEVEGTDEEQNEKGETVRIPRLRILFVDRLE